MKQLSLRFSGAILISLFVALILSLLPLSSSLVIWRPEWIVLVIIHWGILFPKTSSYFLVFMTGLLIDALSATILGQHALSLIVVLYITISLSQRMSPKTLMQQTFILFIAIGSYLLINLWILGITNSRPQDWGYWAPLFSSILIWPLTHRLLSMLHIVKRDL